MKKKLALLGALLLASAGFANAVPVSVEPIVDDAVAQVTSIATEVMPYAAAVLGGLLVFKLIRRFIH